MLQNPSRSALSSRWSLYPLCLQEMPTFSREACSILYGRPCILEITISVWCLLRLFTFSSPGFLMGLHAVGLQVMKQPFLHTSSFLSMTLARAPRKGRICLQSWGPPPSPQPIPQNVSSAFLQWEYSCVKTDSSPEMETLQRGLMRGDQNLTKMTFHL